MWAQRAFSYPVKRTMSLFPRNSPILRLVTVFFGALCACHSLAAQKPGEEEKPQVLEVAPEAPDSVKVDLSRFGFLQLAPESSGLLSRQVEESMKSLRRSLRKRRPLRITAWVGGAGDARRVSSSIRELLDKWRIPIPAISVVRVGALPTRAARVVFDVEVEEDDVVNPHGLLFLAGVRTLAPEFRFDIQRELTDSLDTLESRLREDSVTAADVISARCLVSLTQDLSTLEGAVRKRFPKANIRVVQSVRSSPDSYANCDLVARLASAPDRPLDAKVVTPVNGEAPITSSVKTNARTLVLSSAQLGFRATDADFALAFERLESTLKSAGSSLANAAQLSILAASPEVGRRAEAEGRSYLNVKHDPAILRATVEGHPALDATLSLDTIAVVP